MAGGKIDPSFDTDHIVALVKKSQAGDQEINFAFGFTGKSTDCVLIAHLSKSVSALVSECKALPNKTTKVAKGTFTVVDNVIRFKPESPIAGIVKGVEKRLKAAGITKYSAILVSETGEVIDESNLDNDTAPPGLAPGSASDAAASAKPQPQGAATAVPPPDAAKLAFAKRLMAIKPEVDKAVVRGDPVAEKLQALLESARQMVKDGNISGGNDVLTALETRLPNLAAAKPTAPVETSTVLDSTTVGKGDSKADFFAKFKAVGPKLKKAMEGPPPNAQVKQILDAVIELSKKGQFDDAISALDDAETMLGTASVSGTDHPAGDRWKQARQTWLDANETLDSQLNALRAAILGETSHPELAEKLSDIAEVGLNALTGNHRVKLMGAIQVIGTGDAVSMQKHGDKALSSIAEFRAYLDGNEKVDACEGNPWDVKVAIRDTLYPPLDEMREALNMYRAAA